MNERVHGHVSRLDWLVLAVIAADAVALITGLVIDGHERLFEPVHDGSSGACTAKRPARRTARAGPSRSFP